MTTNEHLSDICLQKEWGRLKRTRLRKSNLSAVKQKLIPHQASLVQRLRWLPLHGRGCEFDSRVVRFVLVWWNGRHVEAALGSVLPSYHACETSQNSESTDASSNGRLAGSNPVTSIE